jgi:hypothetical protein
MIEKHVVSHAETERMYRVGLIEEQFPGFANAREAEAIWSVAALFPVDHKKHRELVYRFYSVIHQNTGLSFDVEEAAGLEMGDRLEAATENAFFDDPDGQKLSLVAQKLGVILKLS